MHDKTHGIKMLSIWGRGGCLHLDGLKNLATFLSTFFKSWFCVGDPQDQAKNITSKCYLFGCAFKDCSCPPKVGLKNLVDFLKKFKKFFLVCIYIFLIWSRMEDH